MNDAVSLSLLAKFGIGFFIFFIPGLLWSYTLYAHREVDGVTRGLVAIIFSFISLSLVALGATIFQIRLSLRVVLLETTAIIISAALTNIGLRLWHRHAGPTPKRNY